MEEKKDIKENKKNIAGPVIITHGILFIIYSYCLLKKHLNIFSLVGFLLVFGILLLILGILILQTNIIL
jgi:mannose/fructose/N-acetylgalactosamine-specific phosphotransferase system component IID